MGKGKLGIRKDGKVYEESHEWLIEIGVNEDRPMWNIIIVPILGRTQKGRCVRSHEKYTQFSNA